MNLDPNGFIWKEAKGAWTFYGLDWRCINWDRIDGIIHDAMLDCLMDWNGKLWIDTRTFFFSHSVGFLDDMMDGWMDGCIWMKAWRWSFHFPLYFISILFFCAR